jgi:hypothetical protein
VLRIVLEDKTNGDRSFNEVRGFLYLLLIHGAFVSERGSVLSFFRYLALEALNRGPQDYNIKGELLHQCFKHICAFIHDEPHHQRKGLVQELIFNLVQKLLIGKSSDQFCSLVKEEIQIWTTILLDTSLRLSPSITKSRLRLLQLLLPHCDEEETVTQLYTFTISSLETSTLLSWELRLTLELYEKTMINHFSPCQLESLLLKYRSILEDPQSFHKDLIMEHLGHIVNSSLHIPSLFVSTDIPRIVLDLDTFENSLLDEARLFTLGVMHIYLQKFTDTKN